MQISIFYEDENNERRALAQVYSLEKANRVIDIAFAQGYKKVIIEVVKT